MAAAAEQTTKTTAALQQCRAAASRDWATVTVDKEKRIQTRKCSLALE